MEELLDHLIDENSRLNQRVLTISRKSQKRKRQINQLTKAVKTRNEQVSFLERSCDARTLQITRYSEDLDKSEKLYTTTSIAYEEYIIKLTNELNSYKRESLWGFIKRKLSRKKNEVEEVTEEIEFGKELSGELPDGSLSND